MKFFRYHFAVVKFVLCCHEQIAFGFRTKGLAFGRDCVSTAGRLIRILVLFQYFVKCSMLQDMWDVCTLKLHKMMHLVAAVKPPSFYLYLSFISSFYNSVLYYNFYAFKYLL